MLTGFSGSLVSEYFAETFLPEAFAGELGEETRASARRHLLRWRREEAPMLGPVSGTRSVFDLAAAPLARALGFEPRIVRGGEMVLATLDPDGSSAPVLLVTAWGARLDASWRDAVRHSLHAGSPWCLCTNGRHLRLVDARRTFARRFVEFDLDCALEDESTFAVLWALLRRRSFDAPALIDRVVEASSLHTVGVCRSLQGGVLDALGELLSGVVADRAFPFDPATPNLDRVHEQALTIVYRILFLLFAESRRLVPLWHPVYRESYSLETLRSVAERPGPARGLWETLQAISRLAHAGCRAGSLRVTPFNGRLFAPAVTPLGERRLLGDEAARRVVLALSTAPGARGHGRARIAYRDLGVEQLGAVYESVLDYRPRVVATTGTDGDARRSNRGRSGARSVRVRFEPGSGVRKATGTFYTPRSITSYLVRRTLAPLVVEASPAELLRLRVVDPAMGSGAFLVAACRYLAGAYEAALVTQGGHLPSDISDEDRRGFRRAVAQRCLYGVDRNPIAVQLARLSLWLCTLAPERPLTFLDHRLLARDSLVGASLDDLRRPPPGSHGGSRRRSSQHSTLPLFEPDDPGPALRAVLPTRAAVATTPDDSLAVVREKERALASLDGDESPLARWKAAADLWCGLGFRSSHEPVSAALFAELADQILRARSGLPAAVVSSWLAEARAIASRRRFCHWSLEFPEVFFADDGAPLPRPGFDAVIGNPPWDMVRADNDGDVDQRAARLDARQLLRFARDSGVYKAQGDGHANLFQLFAERAFQLTRDGGRLGLVVPWGLAVDRGCAALRRLLLDRCSVDSWIGFDNAAAIFPIHRSVRFLVLTASKTGRTEVLRCRLGERDPTVLDSMAELPTGSDGTWPVVITRGLLERISPDDWAVPDLRTQLDLQLIEKLSSAAPPLGSPEGWHARFGRELNASDDGRHFGAGPGGLPVLEGKHLEPFRVLCHPGARRIRREVAEGLFGRARTFASPRLAYRDVASATNRLTLIAAVIPAGCVTVHTLFCLKTRLTAREQAFLCGVLNSFVANYLVRQRVTTHVGVGIIARLPVPRPPAESPSFARIADLSGVLAGSNGRERLAAYPELQAIVARLYGLTREELEHVLGTFPLVEEETKTRTLESFSERDVGR